MIFNDNQLIENEFYKPLIIKDIESTNVRPAARAHPHAHTHTLSLFDNVIIKDRVEDIDIITSQQHNLPFIKN